MALKADVVVTGGASSETTHIRNIQDSLDSVKWRTVSRIEAVLSLPVTEGISIDVNQCRTMSENVSAFLGLFPPRLLMQKNYDECRERLEAVASMSGRIEKNIRSRKHPTFANAIKLKQISVQLLHLYTEEENTALRLLARNDLRPIEQGLRAKEYSEMHAMVRSKYFGVHEILLDGESYLVAQVANGKRSDMLVTDWKDAIQFELIKKYGKYESYRDFIGGIAELPPGALYAYATILARSAGYEDTFAFVQYLVNRLERAQPRADGRQRIAIAGRIATLTHLFP